MKNIPLKLNEKLFLETEKMAKALDMSNERYMNVALRFYNLHHSKLLLKKKLAKESMLVRDNSMITLREMELIDNSQY